MKRFACLTIMAALLAGACFGQKKARVAVMNFEYGTVSSSVAQIFGTNQDVGKGIADLLVDKLVSDGIYSVIERKALDKIMAEQNFSNSDRADPNSAAKIGRILGVDAIIIGSITQFGRDDKKTNVGGGGFGRITGRVGVGGISSTKSTAVVGISARMVSTDTAEILATGTARGESSRSGTGLIGAGGSYGGMGAGALDMRAGNFADTILGEAVNSSVKTLALQLENKAASVPAKTIAVEGLVADVAGDGTMVINVGSNAGVKVGDLLVVKRVGRKITDPATGRVLRQIEEPVGQMVITEVDTASAVGKFSGTGAPKVGDAVKNH